MVPRELHEVEIGLEDGGGVGTIGSGDAIGSLLEFLCGCHLVHGQALH